VQKARKYRGLVALGFEEFMDETADNGLHVIPRSQRHSVQNRMVIGGQLLPKFFGACGHCALDISHVALFDMASVPGLAHPLRVRNQPAILAGWCVMRLASMQLLSGSRID
jgi:hypothetical protein